VIKAGKKTHFEETQKFSVSWGKHTQIEANESWKL
jgi:hypothetical protein